jgi:CRISPR/Cas system CMR-associated protein Cmr5 small subunit
MKNLEQIRAANALDYAAADVNTRGAKGGEVVKKLPALIMSNGLLAAGAFAYAKGEGWSVCFDHLAAHLAHNDVKVVPHEAKNLRLLMDFLSKNADSSTLKHATDETLAWLSFASRFIKKPKDEGLTK